MEIRISRILSEYYNYTRKEAEEFIRQGRVTRNGEVVAIGDKAEINDVVELDAVKIPLKGIFKKVKQEHADREQENQYRALQETTRAGKKNSSPRHKLPKKGGYKGHQRPQRMRFSDIEEWTIK